MELRIDTKFQSLFSWMSLWKVPGAEHSGRGSHCFNPCSLGCRSESVIGFQIKYWDILFQSLFSWMSLWKFKTTLAFVLFRRSFNPCSLGCRSESLSLFSAYLGHKSVSILVLLDVALKAGKVIVINEYGDFGFNPCSLGCRSERLDDLFDMCLEEQFQSLFSWMSLWKP